MSKIVFGIIGGGWRADFYLRIAKEIPDLFQVSGMVVRDENKARAIENKWGVKTFRTLDPFLDEVSFSFVVLSVPWPVCPLLITELTQRGIPVLSETPPAPDLDGLIALHHSIDNKAKVQVAEQYLFQPMHAARIAVARSGKLGEITQAQVSAAHGYHGISLIRHLLGIRFKDAVITARRFVSPIVEGPNRSGPPKEEKRSQSSQHIAILDFGDQLGVFDFTGDQYFSWIRKPRVLVRGDRGEIVNSEVSYLHDFQTPIYSELKRVNAGENGNLEGYYHKGIVSGTEWVYINPFIPGRLTDDEIAIATSLTKMDHYVKGGPSFYSLAEASQDHYLGMMIDHALKTNSTVTTTQQPWAKC